jgi:hypothetical protein
MFVIFDRSMAWRMILTLCTQDQISCFGLIAARQTSQPADRDPLLMNVLIGVLDPETWIVRSPHATITQPLPALANP